MKFKYRWLLIRSVALIMVIYISAVALSMPIGAVVDTSRGEGDNFDITAASSFPMTVGFAFRSSSDSEYNYITATDIGGYGQEYNRTLTGTDEFTYTFDELNENATTTRYLHYTFGNIYWSSQSLFGYRYGFQPLILSCDTLGTDEACETIVLRAPEVVFNTYVFDHYKGTGYTLEDLAYLGIPVISAPQVYGPSESKYVGTCSIRYSVTDQHGNTKDFNYSVSYSSENNDYIPLLNVDDLYTYYNAIDPASDSPKILITDWYVYWDVDYYEYVDTTQPSYIDVDVYAANGNLVYSDGITITDDIGLTFSQWASHFSQPGYSVEVTDSYVRLTYTSGADSYVGYIYNGIDRVTGSTVIAEGITYGTTLNYDALVGTWVFNRTLPFISNSSSDTAYYAFAAISGTYYGLDSSGDFVNLPLASIAFKLNIYGTDSRYRMSFSNSENLINGIGGVGSCTTYYTSESGAFDVWESYYGTLDGLGFVTTDRDHSATVSDDILARTFNITTTFDELEFTEVLPGYSQESMKSLFLSYIQSNATKQISASTVAVSEEPISSSTDTPVETASGEWGKVDSDKRNIVQIGYPLYDTSSGDPDYAALLSYPDFDNFLKGSTIDIPTVPGYPGEPDEEVSSLTRWLGAAVSGFTDVELWKGFSIGGLLGIIVSFSVVMMFLKVFAGG